VIGQKLRLSVHHGTITYELINTDKLSLNIKKTHYILFHYYQRKITDPISIKIDNNTIDHVKSTKFLGVIINENLTWSDHIDTVTNKCN